MRRTFSGGRQCLVTSPCSQWNITAALTAAPVLMQNHSGGADSVCHVTRFAPHPSYVRCFGLLSPPPHPPTHPFPSPRVSPWIQVPLLRQVCIKQSHNDIDLSTFCIKSVLIWIRHVDIVSDRTPSGRCVNREKWGEHKLATEKKEKEKN